MVWGVNFGYNNVTNAVNMAKAIVNAFASSDVIDSGVVLERIEVGTSYALRVPAFLPFMIYVQGTRLTCTEAMASVKRGTGLSRTMCLTGNLSLVLSWKQQGFTAGTGLSPSKERPFHRRHSPLGRSSHLVS